MNCPVHKTEPIVEGRSRCEKCLTTMREYQKRRREKLKSSGKCVGTIGRNACANDARTGKTMCAECADTFNKYQLKRIKDKKSNETVQDGNSNLQS